jgi:hypothetical protein
MGELARRSIIPSITSELSAPMLEKLTIRPGNSAAINRRATSRATRKGYTLLGDQATIGGRELEASLGYRRRQKGTTR